MCLSWAHTQVRHYVYTMQKDENGTNQKTVFGIFRIVTNPRLWS